MNSKLPLKISPDFTYDSGASARKPGQEINPEGMGNSSYSRERVISNKRNFYESVAMLLARRGLMDVAEAQ